MVTSRKAGDRDRLGICLAPCLWGKNYPTCQKEGKLKDQGEREDAGGL